MIFNKKTISDLEIEIDDLSLESFDHLLSERDEILLGQINDLQKEIEGSHDLMTDLFEAVKKGAFDYVDSMTDTGESFNRAKDPENVKSLNDIEIDKRNKPADCTSNENWQTRHMSDAKSNPFDRNVDENTKGMSAAGQLKFERYKEAYAQRLKTNTVTSNGEGHVIKTSDPKQNFESLSGLRNYRIGPVVPMPEIETIKEEYQNAVYEGKAYSPSGFIRTKNFDAFDKALVEKFGFATKSDAEKWRKSNHLTIHESADGMFLVPSDVHDSSSHKGYCSRLSDILQEKEGAEQAMEKYKRDEKIAYVKHEAKVRGVRVMKGVGMAIIKDLMKHVIANLVSSFYNLRKLIMEKGLLAYFKEVLSVTWTKVKLKALNILRNIGANIKGAIVTELLNAVNDFLLGTFKRLFNVIRQMLGSIKRSFKVLCDKRKPWQEKVYEVTKILSAGIVAILGFSLNEIIEKGLISMSCPPAIASFIAECLSGLFAGVLANVVLMLFDHTKASLQVRDAQLKISLLRTQSIFVDQLRIDVSVMQSRKAIFDTFQFFDSAFYEMEGARERIMSTENRINKVNVATRKLLRDNGSYNKLINEIQNDDDF